MVIAASTKTSLKETSALIHKVMKVVERREYGSPEVLKIRDREIPVPGPNEVLIKVRVSSATTADTIMRRGKPYYGRLFMGLFRPKYYSSGTGFAGEVVKVGTNVKRFREGDHACGESIFGAGTNADFLCIAEDKVVAAIPKDLPMEQVASICDGPLTSLSLLRDYAGIKGGKSVLIIGASGSLGTAAVQLAKYFGAKVTGVCSGTNEDLVVSLGAQSVIDYTKSDFTKSENKYDIIFDTLGNSSFTACRSQLTSGGTYLSPVLSLPLLFRCLSTFVISSLVGQKKSKRAMFSATGMRPISDLRSLLQELLQIMQKGKLKMIIDRSFSLDQIVDAHKYIDLGHKRGNVVIVHYDQGDHG